MVAVEWRIRGVLVALMAIVALAGCSTTATPPKVPRSQPSWHSLGGDNSRVAADDLCPRGKGPRGLDCRSKSSGYGACVKRHLVKNSAILCQQALIVRIECRFGERATFHSGQDCASSFESYLSCRTGSSSRSDDVCAEGEREFLRCPGYFDPASNFDCVKARNSYYKCRDDARGEDIFCSTYIEVLGLCHTLRVGCSDLLDKYLVCTSGGLSPNECAFGLNKRINCLRDLGDGIFRQASTCDSIWRDFIRDCGKSGLDMNGPTPCTGGTGWSRASYSICEKQGEPAETVGVAYVYPLYLGDARMHVCWAPRGEQRPMAEMAMQASGEHGVRAIYRHGETTYEPM